MRYTSLDQIQAKELADSAAASIAWAISRDSRLNANPLETFVKKGWQQYRHLVTKDAGVLLSTDEGIAGLPIDSGFVAQVDRASFMSQLAGVLQLPLSAAGRIQVTVVEGVIVAEGDEKPVQRATFAVAGPPQKAVAQLIVSDETLRATDAETQSGITGALTSAVAAAMDRQLVTLLTAGTPAVSADPGVLLGALSGGAPSQPYLVGGFDTLVPLAGTLADLRSLGVGIVPSAAAAGVLLAIDAAGLLFSDAGGSVEVARHATLVVSNGDSPETFTTLNLFQQNLRALRGERWFRLGFRPDAVAHASVGSP